MQSWNQWPNRSDLIVMPITVDDNKHILFNLIYEAMFVAYASAPISLQTIFQRMRPASAFEWVAFNFFDKLVDSFPQAAIGIVPVKVGFPSFFSPKFVH